MRPQSQLGIPDFQNIRGNLSQAVAGIKGTTFVIEDTPKSSTIKLLEGEIDLAAKGGERVKMGGGEMITVREGRIIRNERFSAKEELAQWDVKTQKLVNDKLAAAGVSLDDDAPAAAEAGAVVPSPPPAAPRETVSGDPAAQRKAACDKYTRLATMYSELVRSMAFHSPIPTIRSMRESDIA